MKNYFINLFQEFKEGILSFLQLPSNFKEIITSPMTVLTILGCIAIIILFIRIRKINLTKQIIARIGIALSLSVILSFIKIYHFPQGGSITLGRFVPIYIIAFMYGPEIGLFTGLISGILDFILGPYIYSPIQVFFDYPLAFMMLGLAGFFPNKKTIGVIVGTLGRMTCSVISGVAFFGSYAPEGMNPIVYSLAVNVPVIGIEGLICLVIIKLVPIDQIIKQFNKDNTVKI